MEHITSHPLFDTAKEFALENLKPLIVIIISIITAHGPLPIFLQISWIDWMPFLEVLKTLISTIAITISTIILILNYLKKKKNGDKS